MSKGIKIFRKPGMVYWHIFAKDADSLLEFITPNRYMIIKPYCSKFGKRKEENRDYILKSRHQPHDEIADVYIGKNFF